MATKLNSNINLLVKRYKGFVPNAGFVLVESMHGDGMEWSVLKEFQLHAKKYRMKRFHITDIEPLECKDHPPMVWGSSPVKYKKDTLHFSGKQGLFKVQFSDGSIMVALWYISGFGKGTAIECLLATERNVLHKFKKMLNKQRRHNSKPKNGFYKLFTGAHGQLGYKEVDHPSLIETVHPTINDLEKDMNFFFDNVDVFSRYGMPGVRKAMLIGPPGTGKTSMCIKFAREYSKTHCVTVGTDLGSVALHLAACAHHKVPTVVILEDAESTLKDEYQGTASGVLNFLDGVDQPTNKKGAYVIMTTNHPNKIEDRVLKRPGRIDRIYQVGPLKGQYALDCAKIYFAEALKYTKKTSEKLTSIVSGMTGAQIRELSNSTRAYCASNQKDFTLESISEVRKQLTDDLSEAQQFAEDNSLMIEKPRNNVGFNRDCDIPF